MDKVLKVLILVLLLVFLFGRDYFPNDVVYWITYALVGVLIVPLWFSMFWVSKKAAIRILGKNPDFDIFCGRVSLNVSDDLSRGRLCFVDGKAVLIKKQNGKKQIDWQIDIDSITSIGFGKVAKVRKGFTIYDEEGGTEFTCAAINKHRSQLYDALGWKEEKNV